MHLAPVTKVGNKKCRARNAFLCVFCLVFKSACVLKTYSGFNLFLEIKDEFTRYNYNSCFGGIHLVLN